MREITQSYLEEQNRKIERIIQEKGSVKVHFLGLELEIPPFLLRTYNELTKVYEVDDIRDLRRHYDTLISYTKTPFLNRLRLKAWTYTALVPALLKNREWIRQFDKQECLELMNLIGARKNLTNFNQGAIDNIYFENIGFVRKRTLEYCTFDVFDRYEESMKGLFIYKNPMEAKEIDDWMDMIGNVVSSPPKTPFDINFQAMPKDYSLPSPPNAPGYLNRSRGERIFVTRTCKHGREREKNSEVNAPSDFLSPSLIFS